MHNLERPPLRILYQIRTIERVPPEKVEIVYMRIFHIKHDKRFVAVGGTQEIDETVQQFALYRLRRKEELMVLQTGLLFVSKKRGFCIAILRDGCVADFSGRHDATRIGQQRSQ